MFRFISPGEEYDWNEDLVGFKYVGKTMGCGCCVEYIGITRENCEKYIKELEDRLEQAKSILAEIN